MEDFDQIKQNLLKQLHRCVVCHRQYEEGDISSIQRRPGVWTLMIECDQCHSRNYVAAVTQNGSAEDAVLEIRKLTQDALSDVNRRILSHMLPHDQPETGEKIPADTGPVTAEDVLEMHTFLEDFDGDFASLFRSSES